MPNKHNRLALLLTPWHALLPAATALSRLMEGEMDRAVAIVGLTAREFAALLEIGIAPDSAGDTLGAANPGPGGTGRASGSLTQRALGARLGLSHGATSEMLARLERRRLVLRQEAPRPVGAGPGRPETRVTLAAAGGVLLDVAAGIAREVEEDWARRLAGASAGTDLHHARAYGLRRWLTESVAALRAAPASLPRRARRTGRRPTVPRERRRG